VRASKQESCALAICLAARKSYLGINSIVVGKGGISHHRQELMA